MPINKILYFGDYVAIPLAILAFLAHAYLANYVNPFNRALQAPEVSSILSTTSTTGRAMLEALLTQQASIIAYANVFKLLQPEAQHRS